MVAAPHSCRAATKRAPPAARALVTWKLPLPTTPKTVSTPRPASALPTASATSMGASRRISARPARARGWGCPSRPRSAAGRRSPPPRAAAARPGSGAASARTCRRLLRQPPGALDREPGGVRAGLVDVAEQLAVARAGVPAGAAQQPAALRQRAVLALPVLDVVHLEHEVGIRLGLGGEVEHRGGRDQPPDRDLRD